MCSGYYILSEHGVTTHLLQGQEQKVAKTGDWLIVKQLQLAE